MLSLESYESTTWQAKSSETALHPRRHGQEISANYAFKKSWKCTEAKKKNIKNWLHRLYNLQPNCVGQRVIAVWAMCGRKMLYVTYWKRLLETRPAPNFFGSNIFVFIICLKQNIGENKNIWEALPSNGPVATGLLETSRATISASSGFQLLLLLHDCAFIMLDWPRDLHRKGEQFIISSREITISLRLLWESVLCMHFLGASA